MRPPQVKCTIQTESCRQAYYTPCTLHSEPYTCSLNRKTLVPNVGPCVCPPQVKYTIQTESCRLAYRGRTANHAAKLAVAAAQGQVVCSSMVAQLVQVGDEAR